MMMKGIPWDVLGPALSAVIFILLIVFGFMLKFQKAIKPIPKNIESTDKKTLCFEHHGDIASNRTALEMIATQMKENSDSNTQQHRDIFKKMDKISGKIIREIHKTNGKQ